MVKSEAASSPSGVGITVLLVDDEVDILEAIDATLTAYIPDCTVLTADSGPKALEILKKTKVQLILTDFRMPEMDGMQFLEAAAEYSPHAPRVMVTAYPDMDLAIQALNEEHVLNFLVKPVDSNQLVEVVTEAIRIRKDEQAKALSVAKAMHRAQQEKEAHPTA